MSNVHNGIIHATVTLKPTPHDPTGKDHSGYDTMMKYEVNYEREECFEKGAKFSFALARQEI